mgnify:CR=1 FL=1
MNEIYTLKFFIPHWIKIKTKDDKLKELIEIEDHREKQFIVNASRVKGNLIFKTIIDRYIALLESSSLEIDDIFETVYASLSKRIDKENDNKKKAKLQTIQQSVKDFDKTKAIVSNFNTPDEASRKLSAVGLS